MSKEIPAACPPLMRKLIEKAGSKSAAADAMGIFTSDLAALIHGRATFTEHRTQQAQRALDSLTTGIPKPMLRKIGVAVTLAKKMPPAGTFEFPIEKGIPLPKGRGRGRKYNFQLDKMKPGDSFLIPAPSKSEAGNIRNCIWNHLRYWRLMKPEREAISFQTASVNGGIRVWRRT